MNPEWISARGACLEVASSLRGNQDTEIKRQGQDKSNQAGYYGDWEGGSIIKTGHLSTAGGGCLRAGKVWNRIWKSRPIALRGRGWLCGNTCKGSSDKEHSHKGRGPEWSQNGTLELKNYRSSLAWVCRGRWRRVLKFTLRSWDLTRETESF